VSKRVLIGIFLVISIVIILGLILFTLKKTKDQNIIEIPPTVNISDTPGEQIEFKGWLSVIWGDNFKTKGVILYSISDGKQSYDLQTSPEGPELMKFNGKEVQVTGTKTADPKTIKVVSITEAGS